MPIDISRDVSMSTVDTLRALWVDNLDPSRADAHHFADLRAGHAISVAHDCCPLPLGGPTMLAVVTRAAAIAARIRAGHEPALARRNSFVNLRLCIFPHLAGEKESRADADSFLLFHPNDDPPAVTVRTTSLLAVATKLLHAACTPGGAARMFASDPTVNIVPFGQIGEKYARPAAARHVGIVLEEMMTDGIAAATLLAELASYANLPALTVRVFLHAPYFSQTLKFAGTNWRALVAQASDTLRKATSPWQLEPGGVALVLPAEEEERILPRGWVYATIARGWMHVAETAGFLPVELSSPKMLMTSRARWSQDEESESMSTNIMTALPLSDGARARALTRVTSLESARKPQQQNSGSPRGARRPASNVKTPNRK